MTSTHIFYVPLMLMIGFLIGLVWGRKSLMSQLEEMEAQESAAAALVEKPVDEKTTPDTEDSSKSQ